MDQLRVDADAEAQQDDEDEAERADNRYPRIARIYAFSFEGYFYDLAKPALFLVHGPGVDANEHDNGKTFPRSPPDADHTGVAAQGYGFSDDMKVWSYDKGDFSIRLDVETGPFEQILLEAELMADGASYSGANVRGANVRGANVRGANVRGANVRGANVRGANARGGGNLGD